MAFFSSFLFLSSTQIHLPSAATHHCARSPWAGPLVCCRSPHNAIIMVLCTRARFTLRSTASKWWWAATNKKKRFSHTFHTHSAVRHTKRALRDNRKKNQIQEEKYRIKKRSYFSHCLGNTWFNRGDKNENARSRSIGLCMWCAAKTYKSTRVNVHNGRNEMKQQQRHNNGMRTSETAGESVHEDAAMVRIETIFHSVIKWTANEYK